MFLATQFPKQLILPISIVSVVLTILILIILIIKFRNRNRNKKRKYFFKTIKNFVTIKHFVFSNRKKELSNHTQRKSPHLLLSSTRLRPRHIHGRLHLTTAANISRHALQQSYEL